MTRQRPTEPHERNRVMMPANLRPLMPDWIGDAKRSCDDHLRAFAAKYPDRFEFRDGKLHTRQKRG